MRALVSGLVRGEWTFVASYEEQGRRVFVTRRSAGQPPGAALNRWEKRMLLSAGAGLSDAHIALSLHISEGTVARHLMRIQHKLGLSSLADLMRVAVGLQLTRIPAAVEALQ